MISYEELTAHGYVLWYKKRYGFVLEDKHGNKDLFKKEPGRVLFGIETEDDNTLVFVRHLKRARLPARNLPECRFRELEKRKQLCQKF